MPRRHLVLISQIPLWSMGRRTGGPAFISTLEHLGRHFDVSLITPETEYVDPSAVPAGVTLHTFHHRLHGALRSVPKLGWLTDTLGWFTFQWSAWPLVKRIAKDRRPDIVYGYEIYGVPVARKAADRFLVPMVARYQGTLMTERRHQRFAGLRYLKHLRALRTPADLIVMTDDGTQGDVILRDLGHPDARVRFWMNGVDRAITQAPPSDIRAELGIAEDVPLLLTVSRLMLWKRVDRAIALLGELARRGSTAQLVVVGVGPLRERLEQQAAEKGVRERVHFVGGVERERLAAFYRAASLLLSLYDYSNLGNPAFEAMLLGTPLLALDVGGTDHLVHDGENGLLVQQADDPKALADVVERLLADPAGLRALGRRAAEWAAANLWDWDARMNAEFAAIDDLLRDR